MQIAYTKRKDYHVTGIPGRMRLMFFGKIDGIFIVIIVPPKCVIDCGEENFELEGVAQVAIGRLNTELKLQSVWHGHKHSGDGGWVEFGGTCVNNRERIGFRGPDKLEAFYNGARLEQIFFTS